MICPSNVVTNGVIVQREHFLLVSVQLNHRSAFVLVPLENTAHLEQQTSIKALKAVKRRPHTCAGVLLTCPLCSPSTTMMDSLSPFGTTVSSISCFTSDRNTQAALWPLWKSIQHWSKVGKPNAGETRMHQRLTVYESTLLGSTHAGSRRQDVLHKHLWGR